MDLFVPDIYQKSIYFIDYDKLKDSGIKCILFDLDNTCVPLSVKEPNKKLINLIDDLQDMGFKVVLFSNASRKRLEPFKRELAIDCCARACKPRKDKLLKIMKKFNYDISEVIIVGDQLFTDIYCGNRVGITTALVNPLSNQDCLPTKVFRFLEKRKFNRMAKYDLFMKGRYYD